MAWGILTRWHIYRVTEEISASTHSKTLILSSLIQLIAPCLHHHQTHAKRAKLNYKKKKQKEFGGKFMNYSCDLYNNEKTGVPTGRRQTRGWGSGLWSTCHTCMRNWDGDGTHIESLAWQCPLRITVLGKRRQARLANWWATDPVRHPISKEATRMSILRNT